MFSNIDLTSIQLTGILLNVGNLKFKHEATGSAHIQINNLALLHQHSYGTHTHTHIYTEAINSK